MYHCNQHGLVYYHCNTQGHHLYMHLAYCDIKDYYMYQYHTMCWKVSTHIDDHQEMIPRNQLQLHKRLYCLHERPHYLFLVLIYNMIWNCHLNMSRYNQQWFLILNHSLNCLHRNYQTQNSHCLSILR